MILGKNKDTNKNIKIDLARLISTRLLIQANSGGGKSWLIRRLLEQTHGKVQQIVIDLEGEFSTLRERYDYLLVGKDGEIPANIQTAELLAIKLLKLNVSTIIDLSELKHHERIIFVKRFLDSLVNAPRNLWHTCLVVVDEAHQFCPEGKMSESGSAVIDLQTRGRKRGFCGILATQRIAKLHKDAAAECNNVLVGRTVIDIDRRRAANDLGFTTKEQELGLKKLDDGEFFGYGPAISRDDYIKVRVGVVNTTHPEPGKNIIKSSKTPENIKKLMKDVIDLPKEAEEEIKTKKDFVSKINELKRELRLLKHSKPTLEIDTNKLVKTKQEGYKEAEKSFMKEINFLRKENDNLIELMNKIGSMLKIKRLIRPDYTHKVKEVIPIKTNTYKENKHSNKDSSDNELEDKELNITAGALRMLKAVAMFEPNSVSKARIGTISGLSSKKSGTFGHYLYVLKKNNLIKEHSKGLFVITDKGLTEAGDVEVIPTDPHSLINMWVKILKPKPGEIFRVIADTYPNSITKEEIVDRVGLTSYTSGTFGHYLYILKRNGLITVSRNEIKCVDELFAN